MNRKKYHYTTEAKLAILDIVDAFEKYKTICPDDKGVASESLLFTMLSGMSNRPLELDSWRRNVKRWRAELESVPYKLAGDNHKHKWGKEPVTTSIVDNEWIVKVYECECGLCFHEVFGLQGTQG
jgi:hypothetical protein